MPPNSPSVEFRLPQLPGSEKIAVKRQDRLNVQVLDVMRKNGQTVAGFSNSLSNLANHNPKLILYQSKHDLLH